MVKIAAALRWIMDQSTVLLTRWLTVAVGGLFSWAMIDLVYSDRLKYYLADQKFGLLVLGGGVLLALVVLLRLRTLVLAGPGGHHHDHDHHHGHDHDHDHHDHDHHHHDHAHDHDNDHAHAHDHGDDGHDHNVSLWRFVVLAAPLMIVLMGLAPLGLSADAALNRMTKAQREAIASVGAAKLPEGRVAGGRVIDTDARDLQAAANQSSARAYWESTTEPVQARLAGEVLRDTRFRDRYRLTRFKIICCAGDASPMVITVLGDPGPRGDRSWVEVTGPVSFTEVKDEKTGTSQFFPVVHQQLVEPTHPRDYLQ